VRVRKQVSAVDQKVVYYHIESIHFAHKDRRQRMDPFVNMSLHWQDIITLFHVNYIAP
jgi:hypothetical protein